MKRSSLTQELAAYTPLAAAELHEHATGISSKHMIISYPGPATKRTQKIMEQLGDDAQVAGPCKVGS